MYSELLRQILRKGEKSWTILIVHFEILAQNVENLKIFYETLFGWKIFNAPIEGIDYWIIQTVPTDEKACSNDPTSTAACPKNSNPTKNPSTTSPSKTWTNT